MVENSNTNIITKNAESIHSMADAVMLFMYLAALGVEDPTFFYRVAKFERSLVLGISFEVNVTVTFVQKLI